MVEQLSKIGSDQHALDGLRKLLGSVGLLSMQTKLPVSEQVDTMVLPSSLVRLLHEHYPRDFKVLLGADPQKLREFWSSFLGRPRSARWAQRHPALRNKVAADLICTVPCVVHSDAGPCTKAKSTNCVSWSALLGSGGENSSKFLVCSCVKLDSRGDSPSWERLLQDFAQLATGVVGGKGGTGQTEAVALRLVSSEGRRGSAVQQVGVAALRSGRKRQRLPVQQVDPPPHRLASQCGLAPDRGHGLRGMGCSYP